jgi:hypothetical protein
VTNDLMQQPSSTLRFRREVTDRFGVLPNFFCSADAAPGLIEELWKFAKSAYLDSPLPSVFKERLFVHLSRFCEVRYCIVRHVGFLIGQGRPAGDADAGAETVEQVIEMLRRPLPEGPALASILERLEQVSLDGRLPEPRTQCETDLFDALTIMFLAPLWRWSAVFAVRVPVLRRHLHVDDGDWCRAARPAGPGPEALLLSAPWPSQWPRWQSARHRQRPSNPVR